MRMHGNAESRWIEVRFPEFCDSHENHSQIHSANNIVKGCLSNLHVECLNGYKVL